MSVDDSGGRVIWILAGCVGVLTLVLCVGGGIALLYVRGQPEVVEPTPLPAPVPTPVPIPPPGTPGPGTVDMSPRHIVAQVTNVTGAAPVPVGTECSFAVTGVARDDGTYWCNAQIVCGGRLLYGGPRAGFFGCSLSSGAVRHVAGADQGTTGADTDAAMQIDTASSSLTIRDDATGTYGAYTLAARITSVR